MRLTTELAWIVGIVSVGTVVWVLALELGKWYGRTRCLLCRSRRREASGYCAPCFTIRGFLRDGGNW